MWLHKPSPMPESSRVTDVTRLSVSTESADTTLDVRRESPKKFADCCWARLSIIGIVSQWRRLTLKWVLDGIEPVSEVFVSLCSWWAMDDPTGGGLDRFVCPMSSDVSLCDTWMDEGTALVTWHVSCKTLSPTQLEVVSRDTVSTRSCASLTAVVSWHMSAAKDPVLLGATDSANSWQDKDLLTRSAQACVRALAMWFLWSWDQDVQLQLRLGMPFCCRDNSCSGSQPGRSFQQRSQYRCNGLFIVSHSQHRHLSCKWQVMLFYKYGYVIWSISLAPLTPLILLFPRLTILYKITPYSLFYHKNIFSQHCIKVVLLNLPPRLIYPTALVCSVWIV